MSHKEAQSEVHHLPFTLLTMSKWAAGYIRIQICMAAGVCGSILNGNQTSKDVVGSSNKSIHGVRMIIVNHPRAAASWEAFTGKSGLGRNFRTSHKYRTIGMRIGLVRKIDSPVAGLEACVCI